MFSTDSLLALALAHDHGRRLRDEAVMARLARVARTRCALAVTSRRVADRIDGAPLAPRAA